MKVEGLDVCSTCRKPRISRYEMIRVLFGCGCASLYRRPLGDKGDFICHEAASKMCQSGKCRYDMELADEAARQAK